MIRRSKNSEPEPKFYSPADAGLVLGLSGDRVRQLIDDGTLPAIRTAGGRYLISKEAVDAEARRRGMGGAA